MNTEQQNTLTLNNSIKTFKEKSNGITFGEVQLTLTIHGGKITKVRTSITESELTLRGDV